MLNSSFESHSSDEFIEECNTIIKHELKQLGLNPENDSVQLSMDEFINICRHFYVFGDFIKEDYKHPEDKENE